MLYQPPTGGAANDPYIGANPGAGIQGSRIPPKAVEHHQRELVALITKAGWTPSEGDLTQVAQAIRSNNLIYATAGGSANALTLTLDPGPGNYNQLRLLIVTATLANTRSLVNININGLGNRQIVRRGGAALRRGDIQPGPIMLIDNGTKYELFGAGGSTRTQLQANLTLYVATTGSDTNDGLDPTAPFLTLQRGWSEVLSSYDLNGFAVTIQVADGTYTAPIAGVAAPVGANSGTGSVIFQGNAGTPANVLIATTGTSAFTAQGGAQFTVKDMKIQTAGALTNCLLANPGGLIAFTNVEFGGTITAHLQALGGFIQATGNYKITGGGAFHLFATAQGKVSLAGITVTITGTPNFANAFAYAQQARVESIGVTYTGSATGVRFLAAENGVVTTNGGGATALPGNAVGGTATGGQYV